MNLLSFIAWEAASRDTLDVKRCYIDLAGDLVTGVLLSQIIYWHLPGKNGESKLAVERDGFFWLAKSREDWWEECRITPKQFDRAIEKLVKRKLVSVGLFKFDGTPIKHIRLSEDFPQKLQNFIAEGKMDIDQRGKSTLTKGESPSLPLGKMDIDQRGKSLTENTAKTTTETTTENKSGNKAQAPAPNPIESVSVEKGKLQSETCNQSLASHPAVQAVRQSINRYPSKITWPAVIETLGENIDMPLLQRCASIWVERGFNPLNLGWVHDWYVNGIPADVKRKETIAEHNARTSREASADIAEFLQQWSPKNVTARI